MKEKKQSFPNIKLSGKLPRVKGEKETSAQRYNGLDKNITNSND